MKRGILSAAVCLFSSLAACRGAAQAWTQIGPAPIDGNGYSNLPNTTVAGMVQDIAIDPSGSTDSTIYIATTAGGVWKSTDGGGRWTDKSSSMPVLNIGAIKLDPGNSSTVYAGVGGTYCCNSGGGVYRSDNGADSWKTLNPNGIFTGVNIVVMALPSPGTLLVGTTSGLFKSVDGGEHFGNNSPAFDNGNAIAVETPQGSVSNGNISDLKVDTAKATTVYVAIDGDGVYKSTDSGTTFPASGKLFSRASFPSTISGDVWIKFAQSTSPDNKTMFAFLCQGNGKETCALLKSKNEGGSFSTIRLAGVISINQQDYDQLVAVDPQDANRVYIGLRQVWSSSDGGDVGFSSANQIDVNGAHTDDHVIVFSPPSHYNGGAPTHFFLGTDGGLAATAGGGSAPGANWQFLNSGVSTALLYQMDIGRGGRGNNGYSYGALQDNGSISGVPNGSGTKWSFECCGDSGSIAVDPKNPQHVVTLNDGGYTCTTNGTDWNSCGNFPKGQGLGLVSFDPNGGVVYGTIGEHLYQSKDNGNNFSSVHAFSQNINVVALAPTDSNTMWVALNDGTMQLTKNALSGPSAAWTGVTVSGAPTGQAVTGIAIDPTDSNTVVAVYPGFSETADPPLHAFLTTDKGAHWKNISGVAGGGDSNLPDLPLTAAVILQTTDPHTIIVGSDAGVLQTGDMGKTWQVLGTGFPPVTVTSLALDASVKPFVLRASTFGRSMWQLKGSCPLCPPAPTCKLSGCDSATNWTYDISCTGTDVGVVYNGQCHDLSGEQTSCYAGFNGSSSVQVGWSGEIGPPVFLTDGSENNPKVCTSLNTGEETCMVFTFRDLPACALPVTGPPPKCSDGYKYCDKFSPPRCVPANQCTVIKNTPP